MTRKRRTKYFISPINFGKKGSFARNWAENVPDQFLSKLVRNAIEEQYRESTNLQRMTLLVQLQEIEKEGIELNRKKVKILEKVRDTGLEGEELLIQIDKIKRKTWENDY